MTTFTPMTITIKSMQGEQAVDCEVEGIVAEGTGLAYIRHVQAESEECFTLCHLKSGGRLSDWQTSSEQEARQWIALLDEIVDWTGLYPVIRQGKRWKTLNYAVVGALHAIEEEEG